MSVNIYWTSKRDNFKVLLELTIISYTFYRQKVIGWWISDEILEESDQMCLQPFPTNAPSFACREACKHELKWSRYLHSNGSSAARLSYTLNVYIHTVKWRLTIKSEPDSLRCIYCHTRNDNYYVCVLVCLCTRMCVCIYVCTCTYMWCLFPDIHRRHRRRSAVRAEVGTCGRLWPLSVWSI